MSIFRILAPIFCGVSSAIGDGVNPLSIHQTAPDKFQLDWYAAYQRPYQIESSPDLVSWVDMGGTVVGTGAMSGAAVIKDGDKMFFRLREGAIRPGFDGRSLSREDDHSYPQYTDPDIEGGALEVDLGFQISFFGEIFSKCYVNNNGNISFGKPYKIFTPRPLRELGEKIIAPFWADVDTRNIESDVARFTSGSETANNRPAFGATYKNVGYFYKEASKLNSFQVILIQRYDTGVNNFDIEFNYNRIQWETGNSSGGTGGYGGKPARAGVTNGGTFALEIAGSGISLALLDTIGSSASQNLSTGLIYQSHNSNIPGRFVFPVRGGVLEGTFNVNAGPNQYLPENNSARFQLIGSTTPSNLSGLSYKWIQKDNNPPVIFFDSTILNPFVTIPEPGTYAFEMTATLAGQAKLIISDSVDVVHPATFEVTAGDGLSLSPGDSLTQSLHGSAIFSGGSSVSTSWTQTFGDPATITNGNTLDPIITIPGPGYYEFTMTATTDHNFPFTRSSMSTIYYSEE